MIWLQDPRHDEQLRQHGRFSRRGAGASAGWSGGHCHQLAVGNDCLAHDGRASCLGARLSDAPVECGRECAKDRNSPPHGAEVMDEVPRTS